MLRKNDVIEACGWVDEKHTPDCRVVPVFRLKHELLKMLPQPAFVASQELPELFAGFKVGEKFFTWTQIERVFKIILEENTEGNNGSV